MKLFNNLIVEILQYLPKSFVWIFSKRYIAGNTLEDALRVTKNLNDQGIKTTIDLLGEFITSNEKIRNHQAEYIRLIENAIHAGLDNSFSVKPTMFGLLQDEEMCYRHMRDLVAKAASDNRFVRIDMEDTLCTDREIELYKQLLTEFPEHVGIVFQSYLRRTLNDIEELDKFEAGGGRINIRICKGIYNEPPDLAYKKRNEINDNFLAALELMFRKKYYVAIATHDKTLIEGAYRLIDKHHVGKASCEFQMLYGVTPELRKSVMSKGYTMRVYVPYGLDWFNYSLRRLKENPRMVSYIIRALFIRQ
ncbi:MAG: proline dehydrogenase family protein [Bacteroidales bacterium]|nr:proline dehydrogenase family protein [Bacteroidales bacterium]